MGEIELTRAWALVWSPEGSVIAVVTARNAAEAKRKTPTPYKRYLGEVYTDTLENIKKMRAGS